MVNYLTFKQKKLRYKVKGNGKPVVLLHGFLESMKIWEKFGEKLSHHFQVITIDLPGFGKSESINHIHPMELMAEAVNKVLTRIGVRKCVIVGHSMGGYVALAFAERYSNKLRGLVLFHSHAAEDTSEQKVNRNRTIKAIESDHIGFIHSFIPDLFAPENVSQYESAIEHLKENALKSDNRGIIAALEGMKLRTDKMNVLANADFPILFIAGKKDSRIPVDKILVQASWPRHSELLILSDVGHMGFIEARKKTLKAIKAFSESAFN